MKKLILAVMMVLAFGTGLLAEVKPGDVIKMSSNPAIYCVGADYKRYVIALDLYQAPWNVYWQEVVASWRIDTAQVKVISQAELEAISIGGNVVLRPGSRIIRQENDSILYRVGWGGHICTTQVVNRPVVIVPDPFFVNYQIVDDNFDSEKFYWLWDPTQTFLDPRYLSGMFIYNMHSREIILTGDFFEVYNIMVMKSIVPGDSIIREPVHHLYYGRIPQNYQFINFCFSEKACDWYWPGRGGSYLSSGGGNWISDGWYRLIGTETGIAGSELSISKFELSQNYPNPFNSSTNISYTLPVDCYVSLKIYNIKGEEVTVLVDQQMAAGFYRLWWVDDVLPSGSYFCLLKTDKGYSQRRRILHVK